MEKAFPVTLPVIQFCGGPSGTEINIEKINILYIYLFKIKRCPVKNK